MTYGMGRPPRSRSFQGMAPAAPTDTLDRQTGVGSTLQTVLSRKWLPVFPEGR